MDFKELSTRTRCFVSLAAFLPLTVFADPIEITEIDGGDDGGNVNGYAMTDFAPVSGFEIDCIDSPIQGQMCFEDQDGEALAMFAVDAYDEGWWQFDHGNILATGVDWIELILPANTRALSLWVGASFRGNAWIQAFDSLGNDTGIVNFRVGPDGRRGYGTSGYGISVADGCNSISRVIIEPRLWGFGHVSINQDPCVQVSEPSSLALLGMGLLALGFVGRARLRRVRAG